MISHSAMKAMDHCELSWFAFGVHLQTRIGLGVEPNLSLTDAEAIRTEPSDSS